jgi:hypothetical protein
MPFYLDFGRTATKCEEELKNVAKNTAKQIFGSYPCQSSRQPSSAIMVASLTHERPCTHSVDVRSVELVIIGAGTNDPRINGRAMINSGQFGLLGPVT